MADQRTTKVVLGYEVVGQQAAIASTKAVEDALGRVKGATAATELTAKRLQTEIQAIGRERQIDAVARDFANAAREGRDLEAESARIVERLRSVGDVSDTELRKVARAYDQAEKEAREFAQTSAQAANAPATGRSAATPGKGTLNFIGRTIYNLPDIPIAGQLSSTEVSRILMLADGIKGMSAAATVTVGVFAGLAVVMGTVNSVSERTSAAIRERVEAERQLAEFLRTATTEQARQRLADAQANLAFEQSQLRRLQEERNQATDLGDIVGALFSTQALGGLKGSTEAYNALLSEQETRVRNAQREIDGLNTTLDNNGQAAQDAAEAERQLADARRQAILATADEARQNALENARYAGMTQEQLIAERQRLEGDSRATQQAMQSILDSVGININDLRADLDRMGVSGAKADDAIRKILQGQGVDSGVIDAFLAYREQLRLNQDDINRLTQTYLPLATRTEAAADANEKAAASLEDMVSAALKVSEQAAKNREAVADFQALQARAATEIAQAEQRVDDAIAKGEQQRLDILQKANDQAAKIGEDYGITRVRAEEDLRRELAKIERRARGEQIEAIGDRDADAFERSKRRAKDEADEAKEQADTEARRRRQDYDRRIRDLAQATSRELQLNRQRTNDAVNAARAALEVERQKWSAEISLRQQALNEMLRQYNIYLSALRSAQAQVQRQVIQPVTYQVPQTGNAYQDYVNYQRSQGVPGFATGLKRVPYDDFVARLHKDERVLTAAEARAYNTMDRARLFSGASGGSRGGFSGPVSMNLRIDGPALADLMDGRAVRVMAEVLE